MITNKIIAAFVSLLFFFPTFAQKRTTIIYDSQGNIIAGSYIKTVPPKAILLTDKKTNLKYVLDSFHIYITACTANGDSLWKTDPWRDNRIEEYRTKRPIIVDMAFGSDKGYHSKTKKDEKVLWIRYSNTQFGFVNLRTGEYLFCGQD